MTIAMLSYLAIRNRLYKNINLILTIVRDIVKMLTRMIRHTDFISKNASFIVCFAKRIFIRLFFLLFCDNLFISTNLFYVLFFYDVAIYDIVRFSSKN